MKSVIMLIFCVLMGANAAISADAPDDYAYLPAFQSSYKVYSGRDYEDAALRCQWDGASMFHPRSVEEIDAVFAFLPNRTWQDLIFIGVHDWMGTGYFTSVDGEPILDDTLTTSSSRWQTFVAMRRNGSVVELQGRIHQYRTVCRVMHAKVCRETADIEADGYTLMRKFNASYKYYADPRPIYTSNLRCLTDGAQHFTPDSHGESLEILRTVASGLASITLGIHDQFRFGFFKTVNGEDFYSNWLSGHPESSAWYAHMRNDTMFVSGTDDIGFVCKRRLVECPK